MSTEEEARAETEERGSEENQDDTRQMAGQRLRTPSIPPEDLDEALRELNLAKNTAYWIGKYEQLHQRAMSQSQEMMIQRSQGGAKVSGAGSVYHEGLELDPKAVAGAVGAFSGTSAGLYYLLDLIPALGVAIGISAVVYYLIDQRSDDPEDTGGIPRGMNR